MKNRPRCHGCGSDKVAFRGEKRGQFLDRVFQLYQCCECTLMFVEPFSGFAIYDDAYYRGEGADPFVDYQTEYSDWQQTDRRYEFQDLARIAEKLCRSARAKTEPLQWLDFGCGAGGFLKFLRQRGTIAGHRVEITGHDVGTYANLLRDTDGFRILDIETLSNLRSESFDIISVIEVVEHLPEPSEAVRLLARLLKPGGILLLTTGNMGSPVARLAGIRHHYCMPEIHVSLFNPAALDHMYRRVGLESVNVRFEGTVLFKVIKTLRRKPLLRAIAKAVLVIPGVVRAIDIAYGVSAMPCARKPLSAIGQDRRAKDVGRELPQTVS